MAFRSLTGSVTGALAVALLAATAVPASATVVSQPNALYVTYTDGVTNNTTGDTAPTLTGGLMSGHSYFTVSGLVQGANPSEGGLLFSVNPQRGTGIQYDVVNLSLNFYSSSSLSPASLLGTITDSALATFDWTHQTDNICWADTTTSGNAAAHPPVPSVPGVGGTAAVSHSLQNGTCGAPGSTVPASFAFEQIAASLGGSYYYVDLYDWWDWNEQPYIKFQYVCTPGLNNCPGTFGFPTPEPLTISLFGAGLAGAAAIRRRKKNAA